MTFWEWLRVMYQRTRDRAPLAVQREHDGYIKDNEWGLIAEGFVQYAIETGILSDEDRMHALEFARQGKFKQQSPGLVALLTRAA